MEVSPAKAMEVDSGATAAEVKQCMKCSHFPKVAGREVVHINQTDEKAKALIVSQFTGANPLANLIGLGRKPVSRLDVRTINDRKIFKLESEHPDVPIEYSEGSCFKVIISEPNKLFVNLHTACKFFHSMWKLDTNVKAELHDNTKKVSRHTTMALLLGRITHIIDTVNWSAFIPRVKAVDGADAALEAMFTVHSFMCGVLIPIDEFIPLKSLNVASKECPDGSAEEACRVLHTNVLVTEKSSVFSEKAEYNKFYATMNLYSHLSKNTSFVESRVSERGIPLSPDEIFAVVKSKFTMFTEQFPLSVDSFRGVNGKRKASDIEAAIVVEDDDHDEGTDTEPEVKFVPKAKAKKPRGKPGPKPKPKDEKKPKAKKAKVAPPATPVDAAPSASATELKHAAELDAARAIAAAAAASQMSDNPPAPNPVQVSAFDSVIDKAIDKVSGGGGGAPVYFSACELSMEEL